MNEPLFSGKTQEGFSLHTISIELKGYENYTNIKIQ